MIQSPLLKRTPLTVVFLRTHRVLVWGLGAIASFMFVLYLFIVNNLALQGFYLSNVTGLTKELQETHDYLETKVARAQTNDYLTRLGKTQQYTVQSDRQYVVVPVNYTVQK